MFLESFLYKKNINTFYSEYEIWYFTSLAPFTILCVAPNPEPTSGSLGKSLIIDSLPSKYGSSPL
jgi:hypothetical protein